MPSRTEKIRLACDLVERALHVYEDVQFAPEVEFAPRRALQVTRAWTEGHASLEEVIRADQAAFDAAWDTTWDRQAAAVAVAAGYACLRFDTGVRKFASQDQFGREAEIMLGQIRKLCEFATSEHPRWDPPRERPVWIG